MNNDIKETVEHLIEVYTKAIADLKYFKGYDHFQAREYLSEKNLELGICLYLTFNKRLDFTRTKILIAMFMDNRSTNSYYCSTALYMCNLGPNYIILSCLEPRLNRLKELLNEIP